MTRPASPGPTADSLAAFRAKAETIVVSYGGINAQSLALLRKVAQDFGLPAGSWEGTLANLGRQAPAALDPEQQRFLAFVKPLIVKEGMVTSGLRRSLQQQGSQFFRLDAQRIADAIERVAMENHCPIVDNANALVYLRQAIEREVGADGFIPWARLSVIYAQAAKLGVPQRHVKALIRERDSGRTAAREQRLWQQRLAMRVGIGALVLFGLIVIVGVFSRAFSDPPPAEPAPKVVQTKPASRGAPSTGWKPSADVAQKVETAKKHFAGHAAVFDKLTAAGEAERLDGYQRILALGPQLTKNEAGAKVASLALASCLAAEPSEPIAKRVTEELLRLICPQSLETHSFDPAFWALDIALLSLVQGTMPPDRADPLAKEIDRTVGMLLDRKQKADVFIEQGRAALCERFYQLLVMQARGDPDRGLKLHQTLQSHAGRHLPPERWERLDGDFVLAAMQGLGQRDSWEQVGRDLIKRVARSKQPGVVRRLIDFYEQTADTPLKKELERLLGERTGVDVTLPVPRSQTASEMRAALGSETQLANNPADRSVRFQELLKRVLRPPPEPTDAPEVHLRESLGLAHVATMACALAQEKAVTFDLFDQLSKRGLPRLDAKKPEPPATGRIPALEAEVLKLRSSSSPERAKALEAIAGSDDRKDLTPAQAEEIVRYIVGVAARNQAELDAAITAAEKLGESRHFALALADTFLLLGSITHPIAEKLVAATTGQAVTFKANFPWRQRSRQMLLRHVLEKLDANNLYDDACERLRALYRDQALALGLEAPELMAMPTASPLLESLIKHFARQLASKQLDPASRELLERLPHELTAIQHLASNDIQHMVLLQRLWLRTLVIHVAQSRPERSQEARNLIAELAADDAKATHVIQQLRAGEEKLLRAWLTLAVKR
jgi:hypothetical protein